MQASFVGIVSLYEDPIAHVVQFFGKVSKSLEHGFHHSVHPLASLEPYTHNVHTFEGCERSVQNAARCLEMEFLDGSARRWRW